MMVSPDEGKSVFSNDSGATPKRRGYEILPQGPAATLPLVEPSQSILKIDIPHNFQPTSRTALNVMGICCPSEAPLVKRILEPLPGVKQVSVNCTSRIVTVLHDRLLTSEEKLVKALNEARLNASIHKRGEVERADKWPSPWTVLCGILLLVSFFKGLYHPLKWFSLGAVGVGMPPVVMRSYASLRRFILDINILMIIAVCGAIALDDYIEAASIVFLFALANWLESRTSDQARVVLASRLNIPRNATLETGESIPVDEVQLGASIVVKAGEMVVVDGVITSGSCSLDESSLTGESRPVEKAIGDQVWAGTINLTGYILMRATARVEDSAVSRMMRLVEEAQTKRSHTEQLVETFAKFYTPALLLAAFCLAVVPVIIHAPNQRQCVYFALVVLVVACPCALVLSTPVAVACGVQHAAELGMIVKGGSYLETLAKMKSLAMDKTGTLTEGHFRVSEVIPVDDDINVTIEKILYWLTSVESRSSHPMAAALVSYASLKGLQPSNTVTEFQVIEGEGVSAIVDGQLVEIGNARLASRIGWSTSSAIEKLKNKKATLGWIGVNRHLVAVFSVEDHVRVEAAQAVESLKDLNVRVDMLTGDNLETAMDVQSKLGDPDSIKVHAGLLPKGKVDVIQELKKEHGPTGMIGDGINDAPALAVADVGFAMGVAGSAVAMETANVFVMTEDLRKVADVVKLGRRVRSKILQNIVMSVALKVAMLVVSLTGHGYLWMAVLADTGACLLVITNSMFLLKGKTRGQYRLNNSVEKKICCIEYERVLEDNS